MLLPGGFDMPVWAFVDIAMRDGAFPLAALSN
jgi:hypothetical protein